MGVLRRKLQTTRISRLTALRSWVSVATFLAPWMQSCQTLDRFIGSETEPQDHGLYTSGTIDVRPARAKLAVDSSARWTLPPELQMRAEAILGQLSTMGATFGDWVKPLLLSYLPEGQTVDTVILIDIGLPEALRTDLARDQVWVDAGAAVFAGKAQTLLSYARHQMVRMAFDRFFARSLAVPSIEARDNWLLTRIARDGMVRYITNQGDFRDLGSAPDMLDREDLYEILEDPWAPYSDKFLTLDDRLSRIRSPVSAKTWEKVARDLEQLDAKSEIFAPVGAYMAQAIERVFGRERLVEVLGEGPRAFYDAYQSTRPGALMSFRLPTDIPSSLAH